jgi:hypothetical protein
VKRIQRKPFDCRQLTNSKQLTVKNNKTAKKKLDTGTDTVFLGFWLTDFIESNLLVI